MNELIYIVIGSLIGGVALFIINKISSKKSVDNAKTSADKILNEATQIIKLKIANIATLSSLKASNHPPHHLIILVCNQ